MRVFVAGDTHGSTEFLCGHLYPAAHQAEADAIVQVGDFGYWEHEPAGVAFLDAVAETARHYAIPFYWLAGNHDKWTLAVAKYGKRRTGNGLISCRPLVHYIPNGHVWSWAGKNLRAFGGAYSIDKEQRLKLEDHRAFKARRRAQYRRENGLPAEPVADTAGTLWFPEEEMTDEDMSVLLAAESGRMDVVFSHDKPRSSDAGIGLRTEPEFTANQDRLQRALEVHQPDLWVHGHLHHRYTDTVAAGRFRLTTVVGLASEPDGVRVSGSGPYRPSDSWCLIELEPNRPPRLLRADSPTVGGPP